MKSLSRKISHIAGIQWLYLPLLFVHRLSDAFLPNDYPFFWVRSFLLRCFGLKVKPGSKIGGGVFVTMYKNLIIGRHCYINNQAYFDTYRQVVIGDKCNIGFRASFITGTHTLRSDLTFKRPIDPDVSKPIVIEDHVWVGANATILPGVRVGRGSVVAAGAVVTKDVEPGVVVGGVPAKKMKDLSPEAMGEKN